MLKRQRTGSVVCASCGSLVGVNDERCYSCGRRNPGLWGFGRALREFGNDLGFLSLVLYGCSALYALTLLVSMMSGASIVGGSIFSFFGPDTRTLLRFGASGAFPVFAADRWWTVLSAGWLHVGLLHLFFNMAMVRQLGPATADIYGAARMIVVYTLGGAAGFVLSSVAGHVMPPLPIIGGGALTVGASAPIFALLGALMHYGKRGGSSLVRSTVMGYVISAALFGILMPGIDNYAHLGGYFGGYVVGAWLDPLKPERMDHYVGAAICLLLTVLAIVASLLTGIPGIL